MLFVYVCVFLVLFLFVAVCFCDDILVYFSVPEICFIYCLNRFVWRCLCCLYLASFVFVFANLWCVQCVCTSVDSSVYAMTYIFIIR